MSNEDKKIKIMMLLTDIYEPMLEYLDIDSNEMLDEKIQVLTELVNGKTIAEIPNFYNILELYPTDMWD